MSLYDRADLLARTTQRANLPSTDLSMTPAKWYSLLTEAQVHWARELANHVPESQYVTQQLTTADGGLSYSFTSEPLGGHIELRTGRAGRLVVPGPDWDPAADFVVSADGKVRFPGGVAKTLELWGRYVPMPGVIDASNEPTLKPTFCRSLLPWRACYLWAMQPGVAADPKLFLQGETLEWQGEPEKGRIGIVGTLKEQFFLAGSAAIPASGVNAWWRFISTGEGYVPIRH